MSCACRLLWAGWVGEILQEPMPVSWEASGYGWSWSQGNALATYTLTFKVPGQHQSLTRWLITMDLHTLTPLSPGRRTNSLCLSQTEQFPRPIDAKTGTVWDKPTPEAYWYFKQQALKPEDQRPKWMQLSVTLPLSEWLEQNRRGLVGVCFQWCIRHVEHWRSFLFSCEALVKE